MRRVAGDLGLAVSPDTQAAIPARAPEGTVPGALLLRPPLPIRRNLTCRLPRGDHGETPAAVARSRCEGGWKTGTMAMGRDKVERAGTSVCHAGWLAGM